MGRNLKNAQTNLILVASGVKINSKTYSETILGYEVKGFGRKKFGNIIWTFKQDEAPAQTVKSTNKGFRIKKLTSFPKRNGLVPTRAESYRLFDPAILE